MLKQAAVLLMLAVLPSSFFELLYQRTAGAGL